jgi:type IV pilus biogenesis protein CpaD/CtpE
MTMTRAAVLLSLLVALAGCNQIDPYTRPGNWRPNGANDANLRAMVAVPSDLAVATLASPANGQLAATAVGRLRNDAVRALPDSGLAEITPVSGGSSAPPAAAPAGPAAAAPPGSGN